MDTTYWGRNWRDAFQRFHYERKPAKVLEGQDETKCKIWKVLCLKQQGFVINAIVCDGRKGLIQSFGNTPVQMCVNSIKQVLSADI
ncbi:MAG: hypothetical protein U0T31_02280 [Chitinophagales bacterium]